MADASKQPLAIREAQPLAISDGALTIESLLQTRELITSAMAKAMKEHQHYGKIPGCGDKPTLLQPGAQLLCLLFRLCPEYEIFPKELPNFHVHYRVTCRLFVKGSVPPMKVSEGVGECSSMESKHRFRKAAAESQDTGEGVPGAFWKMKENEGIDAARKWLSTAYDGQSVGVKKFDDGWHVVIYTGEQGAKQEHDNPQDVHNTILKIAKKRAYVDATITATASSDFFTQDLEDIAANLKAYGDKAAHAADGEIIDVDATPAPVEADFRETRIHFGKNRGMMLSELTPQQVHWYETDWMPKKEVNGPTSVEDLALIAALKSYSAWRSGGNGRTTAPAPRQSAGKPPAGPTAPTEGKAPQKRLGLNWRTTKVHFGKKNGPIRDKVLGELPGETLDYLRREYDEKAKSDPEGKKLSKADKALKAALALELIERPAATPVAENEPEAGQDGPRPFNGPNHQQLAESLDFAGLSQTDFMETAKFHGWIPKAANSFALMSDETAAKFVDEIGVIQDGVRTFIEQRDAAGKPTPQPEQ